MIIGQNTDWRDGDVRRTYKSKEGENLLSKGELELADFMHDHGIYYHYEPKCILEGKLWYPDFYLPNLGVYVEFEGMVNDAMSRKRYYARRMAFEKAKYPVIRLFPSQLGRLGETLLSKLKEIKESTGKK